MCGGGKGKQTGSAVADATAAVLAPLGMIIGSQYK